MSNNCSIDLPLQLHRHPLVTQHSTAFLPVHPPCSHSLYYLSLHPSFLFYARPQVLEVSDPFNFLTKNLYLWSVSLGILFERKVHELGLRSTDPHSPLFQGFPPRLQVLCHVHILVSAQHDVVGKQHRLWGFRPHPFRQHVHQYEEEVRA